MADRSFLDWPFFTPEHKAFAEELDAWASATLASIDHSDTDAACRALVTAMGRDGWLRHSAAEAGETLDVRKLCLTRETLARHEGIADFAFAMPASLRGGLSRGCPGSPPANAADPWHVPIPSARHPRQHAGGLLAGRALVGQMRHRR